MFSGVRRDSSYSSGGKTEDSLGLCLHGAPGGRRHGSPYMGPRQALLLLLLLLLLPPTLRPTHPLSDPPTHSQTHPPTLRPTPTPAGYRGGGVKQFWRKHIQLATPQQVLTVCAARFEPAPMTCETETCAIATGSLTVPDVICLRTM